MRTFRN